MKPRLALAVAAVLGAVGISVEASGQDDSGGDTPPAKPRSWPPGDVGNPVPRVPPAAPSAAAPSPDVFGPTTTAPPSETVDDEVDETPIKPPEATMTPEQARAYAAWQYQYAAWQYQYAAWLSAQQRQVRPPQRWYGWQTLLSDGLSVTAFISGIVVANDSRRSEEIGVGIGVGGGLAFLIVPPVIHLAHGQGRNAGVSIALRLGSTALLGLAALECTSNRRCDEGWDVLAFIAAVGYPVAVIVDAAIANEDVPAEEEAHLKLAPWISPIRGGAALGLGGMF